jgi:ribosomal protein L11 methyltransferase
MHELVLVTGEQSVETLCDSLLELGAHSVSVEDADAGTAGECALFGEPNSPAGARAWERSIVRALVDDERAAHAAAAFVLAQQLPGAVQVASIAAVPEQDWVQLSQAQFKPVAITPTFWVVPTWHDPPAAAQKVIRMDPGRAFGTGTHPTTRMCLRWIAHSAPRCAARWVHVLDYGCGSGILAIGAALFGARQIDAVDIDPAAIAATCANARANGVDLRAASPDSAHGAYDLVLANILATPLKLLAPVLAGYVGRGGQLVLSGILERQAVDLCEAYAPWLALEIADRDEGWVLMAGQRAA